MPRLMGCLIALAVLAMLGLLVRFATERSSRSIFMRLVEGADGRPSTSKFQWLVWTAVTIFAVMEVFAERILRRIPTGDASEPVMPVNLLMTLGLSAGTMAAAKALAASYSTRLLAGSSGKVEQNDHADDGKDHVTSPLSGGVLTDDLGWPDLSKVQMVSFTIVTIAMYLIRLLGQTSSPPVVLDIDSTMVAVMGLSQGGYLGKKVAAIRVPMPDPR